MLSSCAILAPFLDMYFVQFRAKVKDQFYLNLIYHFRYKKSLTSFVNDLMNLKKAPPNFRRSLKALQPEVAIRPSIGLMGNCYVVRDLFDLLFPRRELGNQ